MRSWEKPVPNWLQETEDLEELQAREREGQENPFLRELGGRRIPIPQRIRPELPEAIREAELKERKLLDMEGRMRRRSLEIMERKRQAMVDAWQGPDEG